MSMNTEDVATVTISTAPVVTEDSKETVTTTETITIIGKCNLCGKCCRPPAMRNPDFLIEYTPQTDRSLIDGYCRYLLEKDIDGLQKCALFVAEAEGRLEEYDKAHVDYWKKCCKPWPYYDGTIPVEVLKIMIAEGHFDGCAYTVSDVVTEEAVDTATEKVTNVKRLVLIERAKLLCVAKESLGKTSKDAEDVEGVP
jgi:hypothetical protein